MKYQDFFKLKMQAKRLEEAMEGMDDKELEMGIKHEMEHTKDEKIARKIAMDHLGDDPHYYSHMKQCGLGEDTGLPKFDDGALKTNRVAGPVVIGKVVGGNGLGKGPATGAVSGYSTVSTTASHKMGSCSGGDNITAGGIVEPGVAKKSVGGDVVPNAGQKQGGPNTQGNIEGTPKMNGAEEVQVTMFESKSVKEFIKKLVKEIYEVMEEEGVQKSMKNSKASKTNRPADLTKTLKKLREGEKMELDEKAPPKFPKKLYNKIKGEYPEEEEKAYATMWKIHKQMKEIEGNEDDLDTEVEPMDNAEDDLDMDVEPTDHVEEIPSVDSPTTPPVVDPEVEAKRREKVPGCKFCADKDADKMPPHWPAEGCKNPHKRTHCTCPVCFP